MRNLMRALIRTLFGTQPALPTCDYPLTRPLALLVAATAAEILVRHVLDESRCNFECTLRDLHVSTT